MYTKLPGQYLRKLCYDLYSIGSVEFSIVYVLEILGIVFVPGSALFVLSP